MRLEHTYVVIPAFQEGAAIGRVVAEVRRKYPKVVVVDDGSVDDSALHARSEGATVLTHVINRGQGAALQTGIEFSLQRGAQQVVTFDADGQHSVDDIARLLEPIEKGVVDVVLGSRFLEGGQSVPRLRRWLLRCAVVWTRLVSRAAVTDAHNGLRAFSRRAAGLLDIQLDRMAHASEIIDQIHRMGLRYQEVPVTVRYTEYSKGKGQRAPAALRILLDYIVGRLIR